MQGNNCSGDFVSSQGKPLVFPLLLLLVNLTLSVILPGSCAQIQMEESLCGAV